MFSSLKLSVLCATIVCVVTSVASAQNTKPKLPTKAKAKSTQLGQATLVFDPNPNNLAVDNCSVPVRDLNQYVITDVLTTGVSVDTDDVAFTRFFATRLSWDMPDSSIKLKRVDSVEIISTIQGETYKPVHFPGRDEIALPSSTWGILFDVREFPNAQSSTNIGWKFPNRNSEFGVKTFRHIIDTNPVSVPIALFYPSNELQHPDGGGVQGYFHLDVFKNWSPGTIWSDTHHKSWTPNWFYYYGQSFVAPYGAEINYRPESVMDGIVDSGYTNGQNHVHIGDNAHGSGDVLLLAKPPGAPFVVNVGSEASVGIDTFARVVTHECTHKRMYESLRENVSLSLITAKYREDRDADGVPDAWERLVGLNPNNTETIRGFGQDDLGNGASPDNEVFGRMTERGLYADINSDWADDGLNWKGLNSFYRYLRCERTGKPRKEDILSEYQNQNLTWYDARAVANAAPTE